MKCKLVQKLKYRILNKKYFLRYAMPCVIAKLKKGEISKQEYKSLIKDFEDGKIFDEEKLWNLFNYAVRKLLVLSIEKNQIQSNTVIIDKNTIKEYFWFKHPEVVIFKNTNIEQCLILPAKVIKKLNEKEYVAETILGKRKIRSLENLNKNDFITVHYNYCCEKINQKDYFELKKFLENII